MQNTGKRTPSTRLSFNRILLVDDSEVARRSIRSVLEPFRQCSVCGEASDGVEAVEKARQLQPDMILMDVSMPRMDGLQATRIIRQEFPTTKIIIVSQNDPALIRWQAAEVDAHASVSKSRLFVDLIPEIEALGTAGRSRKDQLYCAANRTHD